MSIVCRIALLIVIAMALPLSSMHAQAGVDRAYADSLYNVLNETKTPIERIHILKDLASLYWQLPEEAAFQKEIINLSLQIDSINWAYAGLGGLCRYYYNNSQEDSLVYWKSQLDSICRERVETPPVYYRIGNLLCRYYQGAQNYELAISEAFNMINEAKKAHDDFGLMAANQSLGFVYQGLGRDSDAIVVYREGLSYLKKLDLNPDLEIEYMSEMVLSCLNENSLEESEQLLERYNELYVKLCKTFEAKGYSYQAVWHHWLINAYYAELYLMKEQLDKAGIYMDNADKSADVSTEEVMKYQYYRVKSMYCLKMKDYKVALDAIEKALLVEVNPDFLKLKIDILRADGQKAAAMKVFDDLFALNIRINNDAFSRQINQLRSLNNLNDQEQQTFELQHQNEQLAMKQQLLIMVIIVTLILLVLLSILFRYYLRTNKLKNALQSEKDSLIESEKHLRIAKDEAEEANLLKTAFISNISHEVRTPLNAIVGFSRLLGDNGSEYTDEDKKDFTDIISRNSNMLLYLVNDVLDYSRLDSGKVKLTVKPCDVIVCCREVVEDVKHLLSPDVILIFEPPVESYFLNTDHLRFKQVVGNLLRNAAKFTKRGEITLSFEVDEMNRQICLQVTDTGCGIPAEMQSRIFDCFEKLDDFVQGTGLGLPICLKIANLLKGRLYVDADYMAGARFVFIHPIGLLND